MTHLRRSTAAPRYDRIGHGYVRTRRPDPRLARRIHGALARSRTVVNVGAGTGSYEPPGLYVIPVEPSDVMAAQRPEKLAPAIRATADQLPLRDQSVDAGMAVLSLHHWDEHQEGGIRELRRVARGPIVIVTFDAAVSSRMWLVADYVPEIAELDERIFPSPQQIGMWLGGRSRVEPVLIPCDTQDWMLASFWAHPERVLDERARNATSGFARMSPVIVNRVVAAVRRDLESGQWDKRHGHLRTLAAYDAGMRLIVNHPE